MRASVIAAAVIALTQPAHATTSHNTHSHRSHVSDLGHHHAARHHGVHARLRRVPIEAGYAMPQAFARANASDRQAFGGPFYPNQPWQQTWASTAPQAAPFGGSQPRMRNARTHDGALDDMIARHAAANGLPVDSCIVW